MSDDREAPNEREDEEREIPQGRPTHRRAISFGDDPPLSVDEIEAINRRYAQRDPAIEEAGRAALEAAAEPTRPDEMAAGLIHEPGTGFDPEFVAALTGHPDISEHINREAVADAVIAADRDHVEFEPLYAISGYALDEIAAALREYGKTSVVIDERGGTTLDPPAGRAMGFITAARENGPMSEPDPDFAEVDEPVNETETTEAALQRTARSLITAEQQRDFLSRQIDSLVRRLAGAHVAAGSFDMAAAQGFVQKEILPINQVLAQIAAQLQGE